MAINRGTQKIKEIYRGTQKIKEIYRGTTKVYSSSNIVTYYVDTDKIYQEKFEYGESCLSPKTFTPSKLGWEFVGWFEDASIAAPNSLTDKIMGNDPINLYACFRKTVTVTYYDDDTSPKQISKYKYYNNNNTNPAVFILEQSDKAGWSKAGWKDTSIAEIGFIHESGKTFVLYESETLYGLYYKVINLSYDPAGGSGVMYPQQSAAYYNSSGNTTDAHFILKTCDFVKTGFVFRKWTGPGGVGSYDVGDKLTLNDNSTVYAIWQKI